MRSTQHQPQWICRVSHQEQHPLQYQMGDSEKSCTFQSRHKNLQALYQLEATHPLSPRGSHSQPKIWILFEMLGQWQASIGKHLKAFLRNFSAFSLSSKCARTDPTSGFPLQRIYYLLFFHLCNSMYCYVCNWTLFIIKWANLQSNYIRPNQLKRVKKIRNLLILVF